MFIYLGSGTARNGQNQSALIVLNHDYRMLTQEFLDADPAKAMTVVLGRLMDRGKAARQHTVFWDRALLNLNDQHRFTLGILLARKPAPVLEYLDSPDHLALAHIEGRLGTLRGTSMEMEWSVPGLPKIKLHANQMYKLPQICSPAMVMVQARFPGRSTSVYHRIPVVPARIIPDDDVENPEVSYP